ncbi:hypothetical protein ANMWB30_24450 [Arthrobacter sp. MWB30]|nr:hypothetical protein ANMWB30_24450 [Arthrobacter sp. MWB30]
MHPYLGGTPTTEAGYYHRFKFDARDHAELMAKCGRFFDIMNSVPGFSTLMLRPYEVRVGGFYREGMDIVYVVENAHAGVR